MELLAHIKSKNPRGIPFDEAKQLFLWLFCTADALPLDYRSQPPDKRALINLFRKLEEDGFLVKVPSSQRSDMDPKKEELAQCDWDQLLQDLFEKRVELDFTFPNRWSSYV